MLESTKFRPLSSRAWRPRSALTRALLREYFSDKSADQSPEVLAIASCGASDRALPEHGPCLVGGTVTLDDNSFTTDIAIHSEGDAIAPYRYKALLDNGSPETFIRRDVLDRMLSVGAPSSACERTSSPRSWGGVGESAPLRTATHIRLRTNSSTKKNRHALSRCGHALSLHRSCSTLSC